MRINFHTSFNLPHRIHGPKQLMESYSPTDENYSKTLENLEKQFGRDYILFQKYVRK